MIDVQDLNKKQLRLADLEAFRHQIEAVREELTAYRAALCRKLEHLRKDQHDEEQDMILTLDPKGSERRASRRRTGNPISVAISDEASANQLSGWITDRSSGGLRIWTDDEESIGSVLTVKPLKAEAWTRVVVRHCHMERTNWVLGCQFLEQPNWNLMRMFG